MTFDVPGDGYNRFMGRYSEPLAERFSDWVGVRAGDRVLHVGCGPGALTTRLVVRVGIDAVAAVDPSAPFRAAVSARLPGLDVRAATAEHLPFADDSFDHALAQLVVHFMPDPIAGIVEMRRVTRAGGTVATCVWDLFGARGPISPLWTIAAEIDPAATGEAHLPGVRQGDLVRLGEAAGLTRVEETELPVTVTHPSFDEWWEPYLLGVGPAGAYVAGLDATRRDRLRTECLARLGPGPFDVTAVAWAMRGRA
ncbi:MAG: class I SAM-dependent methyltransferase [Dermatophilaceae bacterium]